VSLQDAARATIREWIASTGTTQTTICAGIGRNQPWLSRYLSGDIDADIDTLDQLARVFGHTLWGLLQVPSDQDDAEVIRLYRALRQEARPVGKAVLREMGQGHAAPRPRR